MSAHRSASRASRPASAAGFTIIELVVVMGILSGFLVMLVQLVDVGLRIFADGEVGQRFADERSKVVRRIERELGALRGGVSGRDASLAEDRLVVQWLPVGLPPVPEASPTLVQLLRAAVYLPAEREVALLPELMRQRLLETEGELTETEMEQRIAAMVRTEPLLGIGNLILVPWRQLHADDALLELRAGWFLPGQKLPIDQDTWIDPFDVQVPGTDGLPGSLVYAVTTPILQDLLHCEFAFWSQRTAHWGRDGTGTTSSFGGGPETVWDSARGGWLTDERNGGVFELDRGPWSLADPTDDIQPHAIRVTCVVARPPDLPPEGILAGDLAVTDRSLWLLEGNDWPGPTGAGWVKVGGEWMRYAAREGDRLTGLQRGQRNTKAIQHAAGALAHHGQTVTFTIPVPHAKDDWNDLAR